MMVLGAHANANAKSEIDRLGHEAASCFGGTDAPELVACRENIVFRAKLPGHSSAALRLHRPGYQSHVAIESELWFMNALAGAGLSVPRPISTAAGRMMVELSDGRLASALSWVEGQPFGSGADPFSMSRSQLVSLYRGLGRMLAEMHRTADDLDLPDWFTRPDWDVRSILGRNPIWGRFWEHGGLVGSEPERIREAREFLVSRITAFDRSGADRGLIHADVLRENAFFNGSDVALIDFDDSGFGFRLYDIGTALWQNLDEPAFAVIRDAMIEGYDSVSTLDQSEIDMIACFAMLRSLASVGWAFTRLPEKDPRNRNYIERALRLSDKVMKQASLV